LGREPSVHHRKPLLKFKDKEGDIDYEEANKPSNLITLCPACHHKVESWPVQIKPDIKKEKMK